MSLTQAMSSVELLLLHRCYNFNPGIVTQFRQPSLMFAFFLGCAVTALIFTIHMKWDGWRYGKLPA